MPFINL